jgi:hypothetical protein
MARQRTKQGYYSVAAESNPFLLLGNKFKAKKRNSATQTCALGWSYRHVRLVTPIWFMLLQPVESIPKRQFTLGVSPAQRLRRLGICLSA